MAESIVQVPPNSTGPKLHTFQRSIGGQNVEDEVVLPGEHYLPGYTAIANGIASSAAGHAFQLMAGASLNVRVRRIVVDLSGATAAGILRLGLKRLTSAGTGGTVVTPNKLDPADAAAGATAMTLPSALGTISGDYFWIFTFQTNAANPQPAGQAQIWTEGFRQKPLLIPVGATNGIALIMVNTVAGSSINCTIEFDESSF